MTEASHRVWDIVFKFLAGIGAIVSFFYGIEKFEISSKREFAKEFYKEEIEFYNELVLITSSLSAPSIDGSTQIDLITQFDKIYQGRKDYLVKDEELLKNIRKFKDVITFIENKEWQFSDNEMTYERASKLAIQIGKQARQNIDKIIGDVNL